MKNKRNYKRIQYYDELIKKRQRVVELEAEVKKLTPPPKYIQDAERYINDCHSDIGFMGSPKYYETKKMLEDYYSKTPQP